MKIDLNTILIVVMTILFVYINKNVKSAIKNKKKLSLSIIVLIVNILLSGFYGRYTQLSTEYDLNAIETLNQSVIDELELLTIKIDKEKAKKELENFNDDEKTEIQPNIIAILCESYADMTTVIDVTTSRDAYKDFYELESDHCKIGTVNVDIFGGGTARSEWEFLTGLDIKNYAASQIPFLNRCNHDYTFTSNEKLYSDYEKTFIHPFNQYGWNRFNVYKNFGYDNMIFREYQGMQDADYVHGYVSDQYAYNLIKTIIEENEDPQFIKAVTIQNHGDYFGIELEDEIKIEEDIENKENIEGVLTLHELSSKAIADLVKYLENETDEETLLVIYGDHHPGGLYKNDKKEASITPYLVYSNFCNLNDMPDHMDLSLLYPNAKAAAGLPMTAYEKYLISLDGKTTDLNFNLAKIKGYIN